jgi:hypothetical protein
MNLTYSLFTPHVGPAYPLRYEKTDKNMKKIYAWELLLRKEQKKGIPSMLQRQWKKCPFLFCTQSII